MAQKSIWILQGNSGGIAGVFDHEPNEQEKVTAYSAYMGIAVPGEDFARSMGFNTTLVEAPVTTFPDLVNQEWFTIPVSDPQSLEVVLSGVVNYFSMDSRCNVPDFILSQFLIRCIEALASCNRDVALFNTPDLTVETLGN